MTSLLELLILTGVITSGGWRGEVTVLKAYAEVMRGREQAGVGRTPIPAGHSLSTIASPLRAFVFTRWEDGTATYLAGSLEGEAVSPWCIYGAWMARTHETWCGG